MMPSERWSFEDWKKYIDENKEAMDTRDRTNLVDIALWGMFTALNNMLKTWEKEREDFESRIDEIRFNICGCREG